MKTQDILFFITLLLFALIGKGKYLWTVGVICLLGSGVLFFIGNLFTSQRLSWYAWGILSATVIKSGIEILQTKRNQ